MNKPNEIEVIYPLSPMQEVMLYNFVTYEGKGKAFVNQLTFYINGNLDIELFQECFNRLIARYDILRTVFIYKKVQRPRQVVLKERYARIFYEDISRLEESVKKLSIEAASGKDIEKGFDITKDLLIKISVFKVDDEKYNVICSYHHIIADGWSLNIILNELMYTYSALKENRPVLLQKALPYKDFIEWYERNDRKQEEFWINHLKGFNEMTYFPGLNQNADGNSELEDYRFLLAEDKTEQLKKIAFGNAVTLNAVLQTVWGILLAKYNDTNDVVFGSVVAVRPTDIPGIENAVGLFLNIVPIRISFKYQQPFSELLQQVHKSLIELRTYEHIPFYEVHSVKQKGELFNHIVTFQNVSFEKNLGEAIKSNNLEFKIGNLKIKENTGYDFSIEITHNKGLGIKISYNSAMYDYDTINRLEGHFRQIILQIIESTDIKIEEIEILTDREREEIINGFNDTRIEYPDKTIAELFEEQVKKSPESTSIVFENKRLTYRELNYKADCLAKVLRQKGISKGTIVGIMVKRSFEMLIGILGILKAGGAYLPIDPGYPAQRIKYMLKDSNTKILLIQKNIGEKIEFEFEKLIIDDENLYAESGINIENKCLPEDLAYLIYTSGSTGTPKGVMIENRSVVNFINGFTDKIKFSAGKIVLSATSMSFDMFIFETLLPLVQGMEIVLANDQQQKDSKLLARLIVENKVQVLQMTPSLFSMLVYGSETVEFLDEITEIILGGEAFPKTLFEKLKRQFRGRLYNAYGPTETTVFSTVKDITGANEISIGCPIANTQVFILDRRKKLLPVGVTGEIYISGYGLARGYYRKDDITNEKFMDNPFIPGGKFYRTGDFGRWLPGGDIESLGRKDTQVKIRGYRIELGEIEKKVSQIDSVKEAVVTILEIADNKSMLNSAELYCCFVADQRISAAYIKKYLSKELPDYMVPSYFAQIDRIPLTPNGKIDRKALPEPMFSRETDTRYYEARNKSEEKIAEIWKDILNVETIGVDDNFFDFGGHSLSAARFVLRLHKELNIELSVTKFFEMPTIKEISEYIQRDKPGTFTPVISVGRREYYPVSAAQKWMYTLEQLDYNSVAYNITHVVDIEGDLNIFSVKTAIEQIVKRHNSLRTSFEFIDGHILQKINEQIDFERIFFELPEGDVDETVTGFIKQYDLKTAPLFRVGLMTVGDKKHILIFDAHHIIVDGLSMELLLKEFTQLYNGASLPEVKTQYQDYSEWENKIYDLNYSEKSEKFWAEVYKDEIPVLDIPTDYPRPSRKNIEGDSFSFEAQSEMVAALSALAKNTGSTMYMILIAAFNIFLSKCTDKKDIVIGSPVSRRNHADLENVVGMFVNTLPMRNYPAGNKTFIGFLEEVRQFTLRAFENQDYQFDRLVEKINVKRDASRNVLVDVMFSYYEDNSNKIDIHGLEINHYQFKTKKTDFDLYLTAIKTNDKINFNLEYCTGLFMPETVMRMTERFLHILRQILENPQIELYQIELATEKEKEQIINMFNNTKTDYPADKTLRLLFEEQVKKTPDRVAITFNNECLTYGDLNRKANQVARALIEKGTENNSLIGISVERSIEMIVGLLGILKAGGAFLPIDPDYPDKRVDYMINDSRIKLLLADNKFVQRRKDKENGVHILEINDSSIYEREDSNICVPDNPEELAYVIYTSGSTGNPKGVMIRNRAVSNLIKGLSDQIDFSNGNTILAVTTISFDIFILETLIPLAKGMKIILANKEQQKDTRLLGKLIGNDRIDIVQMTPSRLNALISSEDTSFLKNIRNLLVGGETFPKVLLEKLKKIYKSKIFNLYGPTETTVWSTIKDLTAENDVTVGKPIVNTRIYILNRDNNIQPVGIPGELCIAGDSLARGYLNNEGLTREKFIQFPFLNEQLYRTGDFARWKENGDIEIIGRMDNQVKIRGYRIEPGEIETLLLKDDRIKEAAVTVKEDATQNKLLCAYVIGDEKIIAEELKQTLLRELPEYMVPAFIIQLENMPLTQNGKIDRKSLPAPDRTSTASDGHEAPKSEIEKRLSVIWEKVLGCKSISVHNNFFESGGHSLNAIILALEIHKEFDVEIKLADIFNNQTIKGLAEHLSSLVHSSFFAIEPAERKEYCALSPAQKSIYMICQTENDNISYNVPLAMAVEGVIDTERLERTWNTLIKRHEMLRASFEEKEGEVYQKVNASVECPILYFQAEEGQENEIINGFIRPFDLNSAPLARLGLAKVSEDRHILICDVHHIVFDGVSITILINDFINIYQGIQLPEIKVQYRDYVSWQLDLLESDRIKKQEEYWLKMLSGSIPVLNLPTDYPRERVQSFEGDRITYELDEAITNDLKRISLENETTLFMMLFSSYGTLLQRYTGKEDIVVGCPVVGRKHAELYNIIGMFVNVLALRSYPKGDKKFKEYLIEIKELVLKSVENQEFPIELLWNKLDVKRTDIRSNPVYRTVFTMQDTGNKNINIDGLKFSRINVDFRISKFDITLNVEELDNKLLIYLEYCTKLFSRETAESIVMHYVAILKSIIEDINVKIEDIGFYKSNLADTSSISEGLVEFNF